MALVKCPECGKENVSDMAPQCPDCGYNVKEHFEKIKRQKYFQELEEERKQKEKEKEQENINKNKQLILELNRKKDRKLNEIDAIRFPEEPSYFKILFGKDMSTFNIITLVCIILTIISFNAKSVFFTFIFFVATILGIGTILFLSILGYGEEKQFYKEKIKDFGGYKNNEKQRITAYYDEKINNIKKYGQENAPTTDWLKSSKNTPKCPTCGSTNIKKISTTNRTVSVATAGLASSKIGKQFECKNCGYKW